MIKIREHGDAPIGYLRRDVERIHRVAKEDDDEEVLRPSYGRFE